MHLKRFLFLLSIIFSTSFITSCKNDDSVPQEEESPTLDFTGEIVWIKSLGGSSVDEGNDVISTPDGGFIVFGSTRSNDGDVTGKTGDDSDYWAVRLSAQGDILWNKTYGGSDNDVGRSISATNDGGYILSGYTSSNDGDVSENGGFQDYWLIKINANGDILWEKSQGFLGGDQAYETLATQDGGYIVSGYFDVTSSNGEGSDVGSLRNQNRHGVGEYWVIKMDENGNNEWRNFFGGSNNDRSYDIVETNDGGFLVAGESESDDFDITDSKGGYDFWVVKINAAGEKQWTKSYGGTEWEICYAITQSQDGNYILTGNTRSNDVDVSDLKGNADSWTIKISPTGTLLWQKTHGGSQFDSARSVHNLDNGTYLISGSTRSNDGDITIANGQNDAWVYILDDEGNLLFEKTIGGSSIDLGFSAIPTQDNQLLLVGATESDNGDVTENKGIQDILVVKIK